MIQWMQISADSEEWKVIRIKLKTVKKGLKAVSEIIINGGTFNVESTDDCVHSNGNITINGGKLTLNSGDDGIHGDGNVDIKTAKLI